MIRCFSSAGPRCPLLHTGYLTLLWTRLFLRELRAPAEEPRGTGGLQTAGLRWRTTGCRALQPGEAGIRRTHAGLLTGWQQPLRR